MLSYSYVDRYGRLVADQRIEIVEYDPAWADRFTERADRVTDLLRPWLAASVEHFGSTSVPGLSAKPIVDMLAPVRSLAEARPAVEVLSADGWLYWPDDPGRDHRYWFLRPDPAARTHHLHLIGHDDPRVGALLAFRDALRADPESRRRYAELKVRLAAEFGDNRNAYTNAKGDFVTQVLRRAGVEPPPRERLPE